MKTTFSKKTIISRKWLLWLYFIIVFLILISILIIGYFTLYSQPEKISQTEEKPLKIDEKELEKTKNFKYLGVPFDLSQGLGKQEPFK